jgi:signal transduction histidine kinase
MLEADAEDATAPAAMSPLAMSRIMAVAGHDLKQPLHVAMLSMERAVDQGVPATAAYCLRVALDAMKRLNSELSDIARLSQIEGALQPHRRPVQVAEILSRVERDWRFYAEACGIDLQVCASDLLVETDPDMLHTIIRNFIGNALKYSGPGGHVRVGCREQPDRLSIDVEDDGCGISDARLESIFNAFERGDQNGRTDGLGLGLTIVRHTADLLRHLVTVRSVENRGSIFSVELPRYLPGIGEVQRTEAI